MSVISPPEPMALPRRRRRFKRPSAVTLVAWLLFLQFVLLLSGSIFWPGGQIDLTEFRPARAAHLARLRRHEPIVRYTVGEEFFPTDVERYLAGCSLWLHHPNGRNELLLEAGHVTTATLAEPRQAEFGAIYYLNFVEPLNI